jgi:cellulose synthase/poly-beta-1,6-N-acetylglucosamine synthase-like glycosyltransferase
MPIPAVVIPAHDEENVIARCVDAMLGDDGTRAQIVVVANGCTDRTAQVAASRGPTVRVVETPVASKANALNVGDATAVGFPRFYVDADVVLDPGAIQQVVAALEQPGVLAAAPLIRFNLEDRPWAVRAFYEVWSALPYCRSGMIGSGVYALSEEGRRRFDRFPDITGDDAFVRLRFQPHERVTVKTCRFTITPPKTLRG